MRKLVCPKCGECVSFEQCQCTSCAQLLVFDPLELRVRELREVASCANRSLMGCNWSTDKDAKFCNSCALSRTIPSLTPQKNVLLWKRVEEAKRRLLYDLHRLRLPLALANGPWLAFDILCESGELPVLTGHLAGLVTLSLTEADDVEREARRVAFREPYRTLLGHFRHEIGHFYWELLVAETTLLGPFKLIFGDHSRNYQIALEEYHSRIDRSFDRDVFISEYASSHPWEDWAETFAHFLHIVSALDSLAGLPLSLDSRSLQTLQDPYLESDFESLFASWHLLSYLMNELNRSVGWGDAYPFQVSRAMTGKLHFVHMAIQNSRGRPV